ncbi:phosphoribosylformylglycinamidine synthase [Ethanoligenens harbinense]|uniref:Phosphoribosylformylglycinamidine synthase n=1 Tax=Ethanoligenens harbinense (strain DSM 18485 / JCM 12961 / CGMCC 1.5033 / YUAN-3) TaxID=663278 RepID=E6U4Z0_ETHHY|nr:phosphoribosylformylglycinamidine synthase [Ethanoligenens harbinense]ADU26696.1 phosphoribosylformylglycinamidine synthase [Ethanoligenens harbinense YUAN-3]AVQ95811.1 phosphoribosylformylglycinamidine synthase [Ethanoligenens harbinense YUAN-3]AYF38472.1 phosphoribosylformylglycinamidine synthase [Ethanoligenens harbinense]AYF41218.1 phosphoribosylformylglycinamidine synthase [Ethanoligenens harbinense]QCN92051.1 phosphoribosylformylglycinamidine synthase [Ethanoligenens harbinense]
MPVYRIFVEKRPPFAVEATGVLADLKTSLRLEGLDSLRILNRYDVEGISEETFQAAIPTVFSEPQVDVTSLEPAQPAENERMFAMEYLPGQFDQRADSCAQCIALLTQGDKPAVRTAHVFILGGTCTDKAFEKIKAYLINPVESREASLEKPETLKDEFELPGKVKILKNFCALNREQQEEFAKHFGLAMDVDDIEFCRRYFSEVEKRDPTVTELRMIDTYWSDHCRHTTFLTELDDVEIEPDYIRKTYKKYMACREQLYKNRTKPITLMDVATMGARKLKAEGALPDLDESEEINACSVKIQADVGGKEEDWLLMFKNETHNHPTEIEPFGGAATCLGGAIRDPLSGRSYVYQAMRVTGAADPRLPVDKTLPGKLPQRKITLGAAVGYSSYGNQIGLATGQVSEIYHPGYVAKRLETGAVVGAAPAANVVRERPQPGDVVILLGGRTGRDGMGGATGSSKSHTLSSLTNCGAEVQKGNPPEERKIQRLFRNPNATRLIKRCNDFGAGGVSVAIGELADGLDIDLNAVPRKYEGLDGTELAISESQERMAVVVAEKDVDAFIQKARAENLEASVVARVTEEPRLRMHWNDACIVDISREFLNSNGAPKHARASVEAPDLSGLYLADSVRDLGRQWNEMLGDLNICSQKGLGDRFDSTIGGATVLLPYGGRRQLTPAQAMAAKLPVPDGDTTTCSLMAWGGNPYIAEKSPYHGGVVAVVESVARLIASGGSLKKTWLSFQEFFERLRDEPARWGKPLAALLGAFDAQLGLKLAAIGGKDSMSGSFEKLDVPPTILSFACGVTNAQRVISPEFKTAGNKLVLLKPKYDRNGLPVFGDLRRLFTKVERLISARKVRAVWALSTGGIAEGITKMALGNGIGFTAEHGLDDSTLFDQCYGGFLLEAEPRAFIGGKLLGYLTDRPSIEIGGLTLPLEKLEKAWTEPLENIFPTHVKATQSTAKTYTCPARIKQKPAARLSAPRVLIPVFPGTNCEYDTARKFTEAGAVCETFVIRNQTANDIAESVLAFEKSIKNSQIIMIPGGFSGGDEPDGSGKFITAFFRNPRVKEAVTELLKQRDGLMLGICNGFQALIKLGLVPYGEIRDMDADCPTLTFNAIGRHQATMVRTRVSSVKSPWMTYCNIGDVYTIPVSHGEGRFVATPEVMAELEESGQVATQYVDLNGHPSGDIAFNPNASVDAVEGIFSPDGRVFGKMAHSERCGKYISKNIDGLKDQPIFRAGVDYFAL